MLWIMTGRSYATSISANPSISTRYRHFVPTATEVARRSIDGSRWSCVSRLIGFRAACLRTKVVMSSTFSVGAHVPNFSRAIRWTDQQQRAVGRECFTVKRPPATRSFAKLVALWKPQGRRDTAPIVRLDIDTSGDSAKSVQPMRRQQPSPNKPDRHAKVHPQQKNGSCSHGIRSDRG